ncbi:MAG: hypothetical protein E7055_19890 [Lentisphaerae bacterium]|nr:hypothetical protein [Lentisphaerota bacterium]
MQNDGSHDRNTLFPLLLPVQADFRTTFFIRGKTVLTPEQYHYRFEDSVGLINCWTGRRVRRLDRGQKTDPAGRSAHRAAAGKT